MPRPRKWRKVCRLPECSQFGPLSQKSGAEPVMMSVDEYETIRLIDLEGLTQEECAGQMNVARSTIQGIYNDARKKLADSLVNSKPLFIEGGDYLLCDGGETGRPEGCCHRRRCWRNTEDSIKKDGPANE